MSSNLPPGVTGNEPQITGDIVFDPHAPFWAAPDVESGEWAVYWGDSEDHFWTGYFEPDAIKLAKELNANYSLKDEQRSPKDGHCLVCGDYHGDPEELYPHERY